jgi:methionyl-tRNA formyltransferase
VSRLKIAFMGTPDFAKETLEKLCLYHDVICVYTQEPKPKGRGYKLSKSPVHEYAELKGIEVRTPKTLKNVEEQNYFKNLKLDVAVVAAYGLLLPGAILDAPKWGCLNIHGSLLPRWRGASPIQHAILYGDLETGVTIMKMDIGMDTGSMLLKRSLKIEAFMTAGDVFNLLAPLGGDLMLEALENIENLIPEPQDDVLATHAPKIMKQDGLLDWNLPAEVLERKVRAFSPWPGTYFEHQGEQFKVLKARVEKSNKGSPGEFLEELMIQTSQDILKILEIQRSGHKAMSAEEFLRGFSF